MKKIIPVLFTCRLEQWKREMGGITLVKKGYTWSGDMQKVGQMCIMYRIAEWYNELGLFAKRVGKLEVIRDIQMTEGADRLDGTGYGVRKDRSTPDADEMV